MAVQRLEIYKCLVCGIVTEILDAGAGEPVCCGQVMQHQAEQTADPAEEKHMPIIEHCDGGVRVTVGSTRHPMETKHFIQCIELIDGQDVHKRFLSPGDEPIAWFHVESSDVRAREFCNIHGLWVS